MKIMGTSLDPFLFWKKGQSVAGALRFGSSNMATLLRGGLGAYVGNLGPRPERRLALYETEACPASRKVREALSMLDLDADVRPCPEGGSVHMRELEALDTKTQIPTLVDANTAVVLQGSDAIVAYLFKTYGDGRVPFLLRLGPVTNAASALASAARGGHGGDYTPSRRPARELELWSYEASPYCRFAREALDEHEIPYVLHNMARNSPRRPAFEKMSGRMQFPYLVDPNTGTSMFESDAIAKYIAETYGNEGASTARPRPASQTQSQSQGTAPTVEA